MDGKTDVHIPPVFYRTSSPFGAEAQKKESKKEKKQGRNKERKERRKEERKKGRKKGKRAHASVQESCTARATISSDCQELDVMMVCMSFARLSGFSPSVHPFVRLSVRNAFFPNTRKRVFSIAHNELALTGWGGGGDGVGKVVMG